MTPVSTDLVIGFLAGNEDGGVIFAPATGIRRVALGIFRSFKNRQDHVSILSAANFRGECLLRNEAMITVEQCAEFSGLASNETVLGATPSAKHRALLSSYVLNLWRGPKTVRKMIVAHIRIWLDLGMVKEAADLVVVLRQFLSDYPEAKLEHWWCEDADKKKRRRWIKLNLGTTH
jgi:hypothetical protein